MKKHFTLFFFKFLLLLVPCIQLEAQTLVNSLSELMPYLDDDHVDVKLASGTYWITEEDAKNGLYDEAETTINNHLSRSLLLFAGNNSTYDFTGVTINIETKVFQAYGSNYQVLEVHTIGNNNVVKNLTLVDVGASEDFPPGGANSIVMDGENNRIEGFHCTVKGSFPYGYGDIFGKGGNNVISHKKHSACLVRGNSNHVKNSTFIHRAYGHGIYFQAANDPLIEGCRVEGELRTTDEVLAEAGTGSPADLVDFMTIWGFRLKPGSTFSLQEDGIRSYNAGETIINGVVYERGCNRPTIIDCEVVKMRSGVVIGHAQGNKYVENCTSLACESGFWTGSDAEVINCKGDSSVGPLYSEDRESSNSTIELTLLNDYVPKYGSTPTMYMAGTGHRVTLKDGRETVDSNMEILIGGTRLGHRWDTSSTTDTPPYLTASNIDFVSEGNFNITLGANCTNAEISSCGPVTNNGGTTNNISSSICASSISTDVIWISTTPSNIKTTVIGETQQLTTTVHPTNAANQNVVYSSSDVSVATVDANGLVTTTGYGATTITVTSVDGNRIGSSSIAVTRDIGTNIALSSVGSIATQSSVLNATEGQAELAIDGNTNGNWGGNSVTHTADTSDLKWWEVDLGKENTLWNIVIYNRSGSTKVRLNNFKVSVIDDNGDTNFTEVYVDYPDPSLTIDLDGVIGKIVRIEKNSDRALSLAEVEVYGTSNSNLSVGDEILDKVEIYPNPIKDRFTITKSKGFALEVYNVVGELLIKRNIKSDSEEVNIDGLSNGVYFVNLIKNGTRVLKKMIKE